ncbi:Glucuronide permease [Anaerococcus prevotii]|uniref:Sugar (Glycoside-Pentoside-Hexuronide) transporter n=2 Tax=Anaerococcus prevotii TaxID=33034 RepID=C7REK1_ANAPD|nr:glycoside-pentoside-hexuronide (GPH):cation symporter [Anaerococcus prevotii]ACV29614.1 sugar (Glycoside-Pentoside-Hexuronide) transporter [Anaerococcus prevotii DSM 20548]MDU2558443.1 glycoside-pentoside-hexuronide (GPH):cation symporter [Anaerococcus prevotii]SUU95288.1 Glucuronide permease [Anaerococcus prevotii]
MQKNVKPFGMKDKLGYMFGDLGNGFSFALSSVFFMKFYTDVMGVSPASVGLMMLLAKIIDAFTDVGMGQIVDRTPPTKDGKFLPWIRRIAGPVALASFLLYPTYFKDMSMAFKMVWMYGTYILWGSIAYTAINIPYGSMASAVSENPDHRTHLSTWRTIGSQAGNFIIAVIGPMFVYYTDQNGHELLSGNKMTIFALVCSILAIITYMLCFKLTTERVKIPRSEEKFSFLETFKVMFSSRALIGLILASLFFLLSVMAVSGMNSYLYPNYFQNVKAMSFVGTSQMVITLLMATVVPKLSAKFGKKEVTVFGLSLSAISYLLAYFLQTSNVKTFIFFVILFQIGTAFQGITSWAMIIDVIDDLEVNKGRRDDGAIYGAFSFSRKLGQAAASGLTGFLLTAINYSVESKFDPQVTAGIYNISTLLPAVTLILATLAYLVIYPLNRQKVYDNAKYLHEKRLKSGE